MSQAEPASLAADPAQFLLAAASAADSTSNPASAPSDSRVTKTASASTAASPNITEAEVQSLTTVVRDTSTLLDPANDTNYWDVEMMAPPNAGSLPTPSDPRRQPLSATVFPFHQQADLLILNPLKPFPLLCFPAYYAPAQNAMFPTVARFSKLTRRLPATKAALARLRAYTPPPFPLWDQLPASRRAAVLILLYADRRGDLRVVLTMRAASLRSFSGHAAFPGGKADSVEETPYQIARREAWEEIGLPMDDSKIPAPFRIEFLCHLPHSLARNGLAVRPCVALLHNPLTQPSSSSSSTSPPNNPLPTFLRATDPPTPSGSSGPPAPPGHWYDGTWIHWQGEPWRVHNFYVPVNNQRVVKPDPLDADEVNPQARVAEKLEDTEETTGRYKVWGMTAKILVEAASCAYGTAPEFEHNSVWGDEKIILMAHAEGQFFDRASSKVKVRGEKASSSGDMTPTEEAVEEAKRNEPAKM
ncbi:hypothetical protein jhhlp_007354 [Lomentospora prolificans]|uniref:Nudix hydrolase domain-containing protein n=1 Tax=Lomentospora prolificans TaxID=41688 RepID=A0A2N3N2E3_9PEZI|nr:hypothetical protein jhhlp_007354 [Lomentospora prolificans]